MRLSLRRLVSQASVFSFWETWLWKGLAGYNFEMVTALSLSIWGCTCSAKGDSAVGFLKSLRPLQRLSLEGGISMQVLDAALDHHGGSLRHLSVFTRDADDTSTMFSAIHTPHTRQVKLSAGTIKKLVDHCPNVEELRLEPIARTRGDDEETAIYLALSNLQRLRTLWLTLQHCIDGEPRHRCILQCCENSIDDLARALGNCAIDGDLAAFIFNTIRPDTNSLETLHLDIRPQPGCKTLSHAAWQEPGLEPLIRYLSRPWTCTRHFGDVMVEERDWEQTAEAEMVCQNAGLFCIQAFK
jgi:hypothetical protein